MARIAYLKTGGVVSDVRFVPDDYAASTGEVVIDGDTLPDPGTLSDPESLGSVKLRLQREVDALAEAERQKYITRGSGQALVYEAKNEEATAWVDAGQPPSPSAADYPFASARAQRLGVSISAVLTEWLQIIDSWRMIAIAIENVREGAKEAIAAAADVEAALSARDVLIWPS